MKDVGAFKQELLCNDLPGLLLCAPRSLPVEVANEHLREFLMSDMLHRQQVLTHADGIADAQATAGLKRRDGLVFRNPVGSRIQPSIVDDEVAVICKGIGRQTKASSCRGLEGPAREQTVELVVDVGIADDMAAGICQ